MNCIKRPYSFLGYDINWYMDQIEIKSSKNNLEFDINTKQIKEIIIRINKSHSFEDYQEICKNLLFLIYYMVDNKSYKYPIIDINYGGRPDTGFEFIRRKRLNKRFINDLGVYHSHISEIDYGVLIWYITWNNNGIIVNFVYLPHPSDDYTDILNKIYSIDDAYHIDEGEYLINLSKLLYENIIITFEKFINKK